MDRKYNSYTKHQIDKALSDLESGNYIKDVAIKHQIKYKYLCKLWLKKRKNLPLHTKR